MRISDWSSDVCSSDLRSRGRIEVVSEKIKKRLFIKTYGCQMNVYDSARMADVLAPLGYEAVDSPRGCDMVIPNTCPIRAKASAKEFSELGRLRAFKEERADRKSTRLKSNH